jgi:hypothetical protein
LHRRQHELGTPGRTLGFVVVPAPALLPPDGMLGTPVASLLAPGEVKMPALPPIAPAALDPLPHGRTVAGLAVLGRPDRLAPGMVIVLFPGVGEDGTVGVRGVVMVPGASGMVERAAGPTGGIKRGEGIEPAMALPASAQTSAALNDGNMRDPQAVGSFIAALSRSNGKMVTRCGGSKFR